MSGYTRKKQPELVRQTLLECAAKLAVEEGLGGVTVQAVAEAAGVTKGGLFHHFPSKRDLVEGLFDDLIGRLDRDIDARLEEMSGPGCFTRAYVEAVFREDDGGFGEPWVALSVAMIAEPNLRSLWAEWLKQRLRRHHETDNAPLLEIVRLAADGAWLARVSSYEHALDHDIGELKRRLLALI